MMPIIAAGFRRWLGRHRDAHITPPGSIATPEAVALQSASEPPDGLADEHQQTNREPDYNSIFLEARDDFLGSLPDDEKRIFMPCDSAISLLKKISDFQIQGGNKKSLEHVQSFCNAVEPYFVAIGFISQANPFAAITWGSIVLVFQFSRGFVSFFDGLAYTLGRLAAEMPQYDALVNLWKTYGLEPSPRLKSSLVNIYVELLRFLKTIAGIFTRENKSNRHKLLVAAKLGWRPFDARFQEFRDHLLIHRDIIEKEILLVTVDKTLKLDAAVAGSLLLNGEDKRLLREAVARMEECCKTSGDRPKDEAFARALDWLSATEFDLEFESASQKRTPNTGQWLFATEHFHEWVSNQSSRPPRRPGQFDDNVFWVHGNPGCGKTILACSSIEELKTRGAIVSYFFFRWDEKGKNGALDAYRALLSQILSSQRDNADLLDKFLFFMQGPTGGRQVSSRKRLLELLEICLSLRNSTTPYIVLDGVDECHDGGQLIEDLLYVTRNETTTKILLFSRPHTHSLPDAVPYHRQYSVGKQNTSDIRKYLNSELTKLKSKFPQDTNLTELVNHLVTGADGMFLWAFLMMGYLDGASSLTPFRRVKIILNITFPERLEDMYQRIMTQIRSRYETDRKFARFIITWLLYSRVVLTTDAIKDAVAIWSGDSDYPDFERSVLSSCACLVEAFGLPSQTYQKDDARGFRFIHQSAKEFILASSGNNPLYTTPIDAHYTIFRICLEYMMTRFPDRSLSGRPGVDACPSEVIDKLPLSQYAAGNWMSHLCNVNMAKPEDKSRTECLSAEHWSHLMALLLGFLSEKTILKTWIEATFLFEKGLRLEDFLAWSSNHKETRNPSLYDDQNGVFDTSFKFCEELQELIDDWGTDLISSPSSIWLECTAFTSYKYLGKSDSMSYTPVRPRSTKTLCEISEASMDGSHISVLRIVPSSLFMIQSESGEIPSLSELKDACSSWLAHYQIFTTEQKPRLTIDVSILLDENEVFLHMHQSLWFGTCIPHSPQELASLFKIQFPVAIRPSLDAFTVLRDVYKIHAHDNPGFDRSYTASRITFDFSPDVAQRWETSYFTTRLAKRMECIIWGCSKDAIHRMAETYSYFLTFTPDDRYLLFRDEEERTFVRFVIFELQDPVQGSWSLVAWTQRMLPIGKQVSLSFCQTQPLAAISFGAQVFLWPFKSKSSKFFVCRHDAVDPVGRLMDFSECGLYLIIRDGSSSLPQVLPVPSHIRRLLSEDKPRAGQGAVEVAQGGELIQFGNNNLSLAGLGIGPGSLIPKNSSLVAADGRAKGIGVVHSSDRVAIQLWESSGASSDTRETRVELTKLPKWECMESAAASIPAPRTGDEEIKVILNKKGRQWNMLLEPDPRLPAIIRRDLGTLQVRPGNLLESSSGIQKRKGDPADRI